MDPAEVVCKGSQGLAPQCSGSNNWPQPMGKTYSVISEEQKGWIAKQRIFFVATAPMSTTGHINCSPKGGDTGRVLDDSTFAYVDLTGSGIETTAHLQENGRIVVMFCAFEGPPKIIRLHGTGSVVYLREEAFGPLAAKFPDVPGIRAIIRVKVSRVSDSCGFSVPFFDFVEDRDGLSVWSEKKGEDGLAEYRAKKNRLSIDSLPGYVVPGPFRGKTD
jgi:hypothetical protein